MIIIYFVNYIFPTTYQRSINYIKVIVKINSRIELYLYFLWKVSVLSVQY